MGNILDDLRTAIAELKDVFQYRAYQPQVQERERIEPRKDFEGSQEFQRAQARAQGGPDFAAGASSVARTVFKGMEEGIKNTPSAALASPEVLGQNMVLGVADNVLQNTVGRIPVAGDWVMGQFHSLEQAIREPARAAEQKAGRFMADLGASGVETSDADMNRLAELALTSERGAFKSNRRWQRHVEELNAQDGIGWGLNQLGF